MLKVSILFLFVISCGINFIGEGVPDIGLEEIKLQEDQQYLVDFFSQRIRTSIIAFFEGDKFWLMRLKTLLFVIYSILELTFLFCFFDTPEML